MNAELAHNGTGHINYIFKINSQKQGFYLLAFVSLRYNNCSAHRNVQGVIDK